MNVINAYLDTMFSAYPQTPRLLEAKTELQGMMEDAYTGLIAEGRSENEAVGQVIRDFGNIDEVAPVLGISADIAPADAADGPNGPADRAPAGPAPITLEEAKGYAGVQERIRFRVSTAIMLFVLSPALIILLPTAAEAGAIGITAGVASFIGIAALLVLVATGVILMITASREIAPYQRVADGAFATNPEVARWADALEQQHEHGRIRALQLAIAFWILAPLPLIGFSLLMSGGERGDIWSTIGVVLVLVFVAAGLGILLPRAWAHSAAARLRLEARGTGGSDDERSIIGVIAAFYWPLLTAIFLAWSFIGDAWGTSWIVWPIGGVLFGAIAAGGGAIESYRRANR